MKRLLVQMAFLVLAITAGAQAEREPQRLHKKRPSRTKRPPRRPPRRQPSSWNEEISWDVVIPDDPTRDEGVLLGVNGRVDPMGSMLQLPLPGSTLQLIQTSTEVRSDGSEEEVKSYEREITFTDSMDLDFDLTFEYNSQDALATVAVISVVSPVARVLFEQEVKLAPYSPERGERMSQRIKIPAIDFLRERVEKDGTRFEVNMVSISAEGRKLSEAIPVVIWQVSKFVLASDDRLGGGGPSGGPGDLTFGDNARFPQAEIVDYIEHYTPQSGFSIELKVRIRNPTNQQTDKCFLKIKDKNLLVRQFSPALAIPSLGPYSLPIPSIKTVWLVPILTPAESQLPVAEQTQAWAPRWKNLCGAHFRSVWDWTGPQSETPFGAHRELNLVQAGWSDYATLNTPGPNTPVCNATVCYNPCQVAKNIKKRLDGKVIGYSFFAGIYPKMYSGGLARTNNDPPAKKFKSDTKMHVASVSKQVTALATMAVIRIRGLDVDDPIGQYFPNSWTPSNYIQQLTFAQLLSQRTGIKDYCNYGLTYDTLKTFFEQSIPNGVTTSCQPSSNTSVVNPINPNNINSCYSNCNTAILRILLPKMAGYADSSSGPILADRYVSIVQQTVFNPVEQLNVQCGPTGSRYSYGYNKTTNSVGTDFGDLKDRCGGYGWYLSVEDMAHALSSVNKMDGKIINKAEFEEMRDRAFGWDVARQTEVEKNGGWRSGGNGISTSVAIFGPSSNTAPNMVGVLWLNSNIVGGLEDGGGAKQVLENAYQEALYYKSNLVLSG